MAKTSTKSFMGGLSSLMEPQVKPTFEEDPNLKPEPLSSPNLIQKSTQALKTPIEKKLSSKKPISIKQEGSHPSESLATPHLEEHPAFATNNSILENIQTLKTQIKQKEISTKSTNTRKEGTLPDEIRFTVIINEDLLESLAAFAYWERKTQKEVVGTIISEYLNKLDQSELLKAKKVFRESKKLKK